jgi:hypothetical protein
MRSSSREEAVEVFDALKAGFKRALDLSFDALTTPERWALLQCCETFRRQTRRIHEAAELGERKAITGEPLQPVLPATAEAQRAGDIGAGHVAVIRGFWHRLPDFVDIETRQKAEAQLARLGSEHRPDELSKLADKLSDCLNPDGNFTDDDRARRRGITIGKQPIDGMSPISGYLTPEARATIDAVFAKLAAPGMCNPAESAPCVGGTPPQESIEGDTRSAAQRNHDALNAGCEMRHS